MAPPGSPNRDGTMSYRSSKLIVLAAAAALLGACEKPAPAALILSGDSIEGVSLQEFAGGIKTAECAFEVNAEVTGPEGSSITLTGGNVTYVFKETNDTMMKRPLDAASLKDFFDGKMTLEAGRKVTAKRQGMSLSQPVRPIVGTVTFDYTVDGKSESKKSTPYTFICQ